MTLELLANASISPMMSSVSSTPPSPPRRSITPEIMFSPSLSSLSNKSKNLVVTAKTYKSVDDPELGKERIKSKIKPPRKAKYNNKNMKAYQMLLARSRSEIVSPYQDFYLSKSHVMQLQQTAPHPSLTCIDACSALEQQSAEKNLSFERIQVVTRSVIDDAIAVLLMDEEHSTRVLLAHQDEILNGPQLPGITPWTHQILMPVPFSDTLPSYRREGRSMYNTPFQF